MLQQLLGAEIFATFLLFARLGTAMITLPTIGEFFLPPRARLTLGVLIAVAAAPVVSPLLPPLPPDLPSMLMLLGGEILIGAFIGAVTRILFLALSIAGVIWSFLSGLASALLFNPVLSGQGGLQSVLLSLLGLALFFTTDMHHLLIRAAVESYTLFPAGGTLPIGGMAETVARVSANAFTLGFQLAMPMVLVALVFFTLLGLLARLMPQMQVFFVAMPLQILFGFVVTLVALSGMMLWFMERYRDLIGNFLPF